MKILSLLICCVQVAFSQQTISINGNIKGKVLNSNTGILLLKTNKALIAIDPHTQKVSWVNNDLGKVEVESYQEIPFTPIAMFDTKPLASSKIVSNAFGTKGVSRTILDVVTGDVLFDSEDQGFRAVNKTLLIPEMKAILVDGLKNKEPVIALYQYATGELLWENKLTNSNFFNRTKGAILDREIVLLDRHQNIFWLKNKQLLKISSQTGEINYERENILSIALNADKSVVYIFTDKVQLEKLNQQTAISAYASNSMRSLWPEPVKILGYITEAVIEGNQLVVITSKGFNVVDEAGSKQWVQSEPLPLIKKVVAVDNGYLVAQEEFLMRIDSLGKKAWKKPTKIAFSTDEKSMHLFPKGDEVLYITPSKSNVIRISNGEDLSTEIQFNTDNFVLRNLHLNEHPYGVWYDESHEQFPVYNENELYILGLDKANKSSHTFDFGNDIPNLDIRDMGYFISHHNRFYMFDLTGNLVYEKVYPYEDHSSILNKAIGLVDKGFGTYTSALGFFKRQLDQTFKSVLVSKDIGFLSSSVSYIYGSYQSYQSSLNSLTKMNEIGFNSSLTKIFERYEKGLEQTNSVLVTVPNEDQTISIIRLFIDSGDEKIVKRLNQDQSEFLIDQLDKVIYYFTKDTVTINQL